MKILSFPSPCWLFEAKTHIPKNCQTAPFHFIGSYIVITAPIDIMMSDLLTVDTRNGSLEAIERAGIVIWRPAWRN